MTKKVIHKTFIPQMIPVIQYLLLCVSFVHICIIICPVLVVLGFPFASRFPWLYVGKHLYRPSLLCMPSSAKLENVITTL